jgi:hypothetical protein
MTMMEERLIVANQELLAEKSLLVEALDRMVNWVAHHTIKEEDEKHWPDIAKARALLASLKEAS